MQRGLLGLLREGPASGYDLMQIFKVSLNNTWPATQGQVYTELARLADAGLLSARVHGPRGRKEYTLTDTGLTELRRWMTETVPELYPRSDKMLRVFLLGTPTPDEARNYLAWIDQSAAKELARLESLSASIGWNDEDLSLYGQLVLEYGKRLASLNTEWATWAATQIPAAADEDSAAAEG